MYKIKAAIKSYAWGKIGKESLVNILSERYSSLIFTFLLHFDRILFYFVHIYIHVLLLLLHFVLLVK